MFAVKDNSPSMVKGFNLVKDKTYEMTWDASQNGAVLCLARASANLGVIVLLDVWNAPQVIGTIPAGVTLTKAALSRSVRLEFTGVGALSAIALGPDVQIEEVTPSGGGINVRLPSRGWRHDKNYHPFGGTYVSCRFSAERRNNDRHSVKYDYACGEKKRTIFYSTRRLLERRCDSYIGLNGRICEYSSRSPHTNNHSKKSNRYSASAAVVYLTEEKGVAA